MRGIVLVLAAAAAMLAPIAIAAMSRALIEKIAFLKVLEPVAMATDLPGYWDGGLAT